MLKNELNCRVDKPSQCQPLGLNKWGRGFKTHTTHNETKSYDNGMIIYKPDAGLRLPQKRPFLTPEYFDGGCLDWYCPRKSLCPEGKLAGPTPQENRLFDHMFASNDFAQSNNNPLQCAGIKNGDANSYLGWQIAPGTDKPLWMIKNQQEGTLGSCSNGY